MLGNKKVYEVAKPLIQNPAHAAEYISFALQNQAQVQSPELATLLQVPVSALLRKGAEADINLALDAIGRFNIEQSREAIVALINDQLPDQTLALVLKALENNPKANQAVFSRVFQNKKFSFDIRAAALHSLSKANPDAGLHALQPWLPALNATQKGELATLLSESTQGAGLLKQVYDEKLIDLAAFDLSSAERVYNANRTDPLGVAMLEGVKKREEEEKKAFNDKLVKYMAIAETKSGNAIKGKTLFQTCLMCHKVGSQGQDIAPALDGSANRDTEALFTAILDPSAAVESGYAIYRVTKKDGSSMEGVFS